MKIICLLFVFPLGCTSTPRLAGIDSALTEIQAGNLEQGRGRLEKLCDQGSPAACILGGKKVPLKNPRPILQSVTSRTQSRFVVVVPSQSRPEYYVRSAKSLVRLKAERIERPESNFAVDQIEAFGLEPKVNYELIVIGPEGLPWDQRSFSALDLSRHRGRLAVASGMDDKMRSEQGTMWTQLLAQKPDVILMIGDNVFSQGFDGATPDRLWRRYIETRENLAVFKANPLVPIMAVWDAHDFGKTDGDRTYSYKTAALEVFFAFFAQKKPAPSFEPGPGVSSWWNAFGADFAFLDNRTFRSPDGLVLVDQTHFGGDQEKWLNDKLRAAKEPVFLVSGDQFFGGYHPLESYEGNHPKSFKEQIGEWRKSKMPLLFLSGDRHLSEIIKIPQERLGYVTFELTSSAIHAPVQASADAQGSPQQIAVTAGVSNYLLIELMRSVRNFVQLDVQSFGLGTKLLFQKTITVKHQ